MLLMFFADGFEEVEAIATLDVIRRANIEIRSVGIGAKEITGSHGITVICDMTDSDVNELDIDGVILPGGMPGTLNLLESKVVNGAIDFCASEGKLICAICAAPMILGRKGLLEGKEAICFPGFEEELTGATVSDKFVCTSGNIITAKGMGSAINFGLAITEYFTDKETAEKLRGTLQCS